MIDYRDLLLRYMSYVEDHEGSTAVFWLDAEPESYPHSFSDAEVAELKKLDEERRIKR